jgi:hypothetical protein
LLSTTKTTDAASPPMRPRPHRAWSCRARTSPSPDRVVFFVSRLAWLST